METSKFDKDFFTIESILIKLSNPDFLEYSEVRIKTEFEIRISTIRNPNTQP